ncbi:class III extradiol ring-cleavage dioxygenase family protein [Pontiella sulfatireligans]|uniref:DUF5683 domain-containing protein n=1 Tax=Pontiella sulfatireligans TaxID=2750658 RepID=A0A6C2UQI5_9BACT|nr:hypothetical protein [Pontiella sulfatireligans]VGO22550.1 hypothetical protein SCARR_04634 [Pontiella sulfatireligans]
MNKKHLLLPLIGTLLASAAADGPTFRLAQELLNEKSYDLSAVEFRRFAMETEQPAEQAAAYLYSSYAYLQSGESGNAGEMLDRAEDTGGGAPYQTEHSLLSAETAQSKHDNGAAFYFYDLLAEPDQAEDVQTFARRRAAALHLNAGNIAASRLQLERSPADETRSLQALEVYANGKDKSPVTGGLWGLIPGAGYWYSGEIANGFRNLILNSLFIFGMVHTASEDQWGAFAAISFFEITWYSGSIYGGVDSAQRYNKDRLNTASQAIESDMSYRPEPEIVVPIFKLNIEF